MSFILDALRKSESERQQDARPSIARIPNAMPRHGLPMWAIVTMAALGLGVIVLAGAWVKTWQEAPRATAATTSPDRAEPFAAGAGDRSRRVEPLALPPQRTDTTPVAPQAEPISPLAQVSQPPPLAMAARAQPGNGDASARASSGASAGSAAARPAATTGAPVPAVDGVPDPYHSVAAALDLPPLTLELLAFVDNPAERFVFINGARYGVGERLPSGAQVIAINSRGAVLLVNGRQLQLEPRR